MRDAGAASAGAGEGAEVTLSRVPREAMTLVYERGPWCVRSESVGWCTRGRTPHTCPPGPPRASGARGGTDSGGW